MHAPAGWRPLAAAALAAALLVAAAACRDAARPSASSWRAEWERIRDSVPPAEAFAADDPRPLCDAVLGGLRADEARLRPAPSAELDAHVERWLALARSIAYDCPPSDPPTSGFGPARAELDRLAADVDRRLRDELGQGGDATP